MNPESWLDTRFASAGLVASVAVACALRLALGGLDSDWILAGFLAVGLGVLVLSAIGKLTARFIAVEADGSYAAAEDDEDEDDEIEDEDAEDRETVAPRLRVLLVSAGLEALAVALLAAYFSGSAITSLAAGAIAVVLAGGVSLFLARRLASDVDQVAEVPAVVSKVGKRSRTQQPEAFSRDG